MSKKNRGFLALHVAHGSLGTCIIEATLPGWERPAGDPESWPEADQEQARWLDALMDDPQWWVECIPADRLGDGLQYVLLMFWEPPGADHEIAPDFDTEVINVRPTAGCGSWASHAASDLAALV